LLKQGSLPPEVAAVVSAVDAQKLEGAGKILRGEPDTPPDRAVSTYAERWLAHQRARVQAGQMTVAAADLNRLRLGYFLEHLGPRAQVTDINAEQLEAFYVHLLGKIRRPGQREGWSSDYAKGIFAQARAFIRYTWSQCPECELPRNIDAKYRF